jgi:hypothetical protein
MSFTLDPEVAEALAPFTPPAGSTPPPAGDVAARRATLEGIFRYADTAQPYPDDVTITDHQLATADGATIPLRWYARKDAPCEPGLAVLYLHGGGMIAGRAGMFDGSASPWRYCSSSPIFHGLGYGPRARIHRTAAAAPRCHRHPRRRHRDSCASGPETMRPASIVAQDADAGLAAATSGRPRPAVRNT